MKATILGCGYVGSAVASRWQDQGHRVTATTTTPENLPQLEPLASRVAVVKGSEQDKLADLLQDQDLLLVCVGAGRDSSYEQTYLRTAQALAEVLPQTPVGQVIFTSSYSLYGDHQGAWVTEAMPPKPASDKAEIMLATEQTFLEMLENRRRVCIFRLGGIYGPGRELGRLFSRSAGSTRPGTGTEGSNWIHLDDIVGAIDFAAHHRLQGVYNLVQDEIPTVRELVERVCVANQLPPVKWDESQPSRRSYNVRVSNQKLKAAGYTFQHPTFERL